MIGAEFQSDNPEGLAARWGSILDIPPKTGNDGAIVLQFDNATLRFALATDGRGEGLGGVDLKMAPSAHGAGTTKLVCGTRFQLTKQIYPRPGKGYGWKETKGKIMELASMVDLEPADINFIDRAHGLGPLIEKSIQEIENTKRLPAELLDGLHEAGLFRVLLPRAYGGHEVSPAMFAQTMNAIAQYDASVAWCVGQGAGCGMAAAYMNPVGAQTIWGNNPRGTVAWGPGKAKAVRDGENFRISGDWMFASGGRHAFYLGAHIPVSEENGEFEKKPDGSPLIRTFLFPASDAPMKDIWNVVGLRGTASDAYSLEDHFIPKEFMCARDYGPERVIDTPLYQFTSTNLYASGFCNVAQGVARTMLKTIMELATEKTPRSARQKLSDNQVLQTDIALCEARLRSARAFVLSELDDLWASATATNKVSIEDRMRLRLCTTFAIHEAKWVADTVWDNAGATAIFANADYERRFRDIHTVTQQAQGRKDHFQNVGAYMLGHPPAMTGI